MKNKNCVRCYVVKKVIEGVKEWLALTFVSVVFIALLAGIVGLLKWLNNLFPYLITCILLGLLWLLIAMTVQAVREEIAKLVNEARRECGE